ncbi:MAG: acyl-CoA dehydrogenase family protein [Myxococcota bacterium]|jgi:hypothetical protein
MRALLTHLLTRPDPQSTFDSFWAATRSLRASFTNPTERAVALGYHADRLGFAFLGGYASAMTRLDPTLGPDDLGALCATEDGGAHPKSIQTSLSSGRLRGTKRFVSGGRFATRLLVVASEGASDDGRNRLRVVRVDPKAPGVTLQPMPDLPFVPEIPHASVELRDVAVRAEDLLPGDGYSDALKAFRTLEDLHVHAALLGYLASVARRHDWPPQAQEQIFAAIAAAVALGSADPSQPGTHLALAGLLDSTGQILFDADALWSAGDERTRFVRDLPLLKVASKAREARRTKAWAALAR